MKKRLFLFFLFCAIIWSKNSAASPKQPVDYVNLFTGTSNSRWMLGPYACVPYGMVQLGPDNQDAGWMGGYEYSISNVTGFSHLHAWNMAGLMIMPAVQDFTKSPGPATAPYRGAGAGYHSRIEKSTEKASPGYYSCFLFDADCLAEMTASTHCGFHKYTFSRNEDARLFLSLLFPTEGRAKVTNGTIQKVNNKLIEGSVDMNEGRYTLYFSIQFSKPIKSFNGWVADKIKKDIHTISGSGDVGAFVNFKAKENQSMMIKVGLSLVDIVGARNNLKEELGNFGWNFEKAHLSARNQWNNLLSKIEVEGSEADKSKFYTNLYRSFSKQTWSDTDGRYRDPKNKIQQVTKPGIMYGGDAFWNSFWNYNFLLSTIAPELMNNWVITQLELFDKTGWTSNGPSGLMLTGVMEVTHEIALMVAAYQKGIRNYDLNKLYQAVMHNSKVQGQRIGESGMAGMEKLNYFKNLGYVPYEVERSSRTLDYAYTEYCSAQLAKAFGKTDDYLYCMELSENWKNQFHPGLKWQVPKDSLGNWEKNYNPFRGKNWIEGNGWQYTWYVPHDVPGLVNMMGKDLFNKRLEEGFEKASKYDFNAYIFDRHQDSIYEFYVNHGNEENMQASFLFNYSGKPWLTQYYTRQIMNSFYGMTPYHGWEGDEDEGQMSAWFVNAAMGFFEMTGGVEADSKVELTAPMFEKVTINLNSKFYKGKKFIIITKNNAKENVYIQSVTLNGKKIEKPWIYFSDIVKGGKLIVKLGNKPNYHWGINR